MINIKIFLNYLSDISISWSIWRAPRNPAIIRINRPVLPGIRGTARRSRPPSETRVNRRPEMFATTWTENIPTQPTTKKFINIFLLKPNPALPSTPCSRRPEISAMTWMAKPRTPSTILRYTSTCSPKLKLNNHWALNDEKIFKKNYFWHWKIPKKIWKTAIFAKKYPYQVFFGAKIVFRKTWKKANIVHLHTE